MDCPKCRKKMEKGHKCHAPKVIQINNGTEVVTFHTVELSSEADFPVQNGAYKNTIVRYLADATVYLYSSDGIPVSLTPDAIRDFNSLINRPRYDGVEMTSMTDIPDLSVQVSTLEGAVNKTVVTNLEVDSDVATTVSLDVTKENLKTGTTTTDSLPLPVASTTQAGVMNSATFSAVAHNASDINALLNGAVAISGLAASPAQSDLTTAWETETGLTELMNRAGIYDIDNDKVWTYYSNTQTWYPASNTTQVTINTFTNSSEGVIKGSTTTGQVFAESDGTGSVNGWDALSGTVAAHTSQIATKANLSDLAGYATEDYVEDRMEDTWQLIGEAILDDHYTGNQPLIVNVPAEWQGVDVEYKLVTSFENLSENVTASPRIRAYDEDGNIVDNVLAETFLIDGTETHSTTMNRSVFGFEWTIENAFDSCVAEAIVAKPHHEGRHWNISCHAGGVVKGRAAIGHTGGRGAAVTLTAFELQSSTSFTWSVGSFLSVYAKRRAIPSA